MSRTLLSIECSGSAQQQIKNNQAWPELKPSLQTMFELELNLA